METLLPINGICTIHEVGHFTSASMDANALPTSDMDVQVNQEVAERFLRRNGGWVNIEGRTTST